MSKDKLSIFISLILRHNPSAIGITLDKHGWANVEDLITGIKNSGRNITMDILEDIVKTDNKGRYSFNEDKTLIRANQGHSISVDVELEEAIPPQTLYHGTATRFLDGIKRYSGIKSMSRLYVHLSEDFNTAIKVGERHGKCVVLLIDADRMHKDNIKFFISKNGVWLTKFIDIKYIKQIKYVKGD